MSRDAFVINLSRVLRRQIRKLFSPFARRIQEKKWRENGKVRYLLVEKKRRKSVKKIKKWKKIKGKDKEIKIATTRDQKQVPKGCCDMGELTNRLWW
jgi:hypothetical protein